MENPLRAALIKGDIAALEIIFSSVDQKAINVFLFACESGNLSSVKWVAEKCNITSKDARSEDNKAFRYTCHYGHLEVTKWLVDTFRLTITDARSHDNDAFRFACTYGHLEVAKWLVDKLGLTIEDVRCCDNYAFRYACQNGDLEVLKWLGDKFEFTIEDARCKDNEIFKHACMFKQMELLQFLIGRFQLTEDDYNEPVNRHWTSLIKEACGEENKFMVSWFITKFPKKVILLNEIPEECKEFVKKVLDENDVMIKPASKRCRVF